MIDSSTAGNLIGATVLDSTGSKVGTVGQVYVSSENGSPTWMSVHTGLFGTSESFVPLDQVTFDDNEVHTHYEKAFIKDAPRVEDDGELSPEEEALLYRYYGLDYDGTDVDTTGTDRVETTGTVTGTERGAGYDTSGPTTDDAMTRSEERLHVGTEKVQTGRARLRKYVVTEQQNVTVPVTHEEVRLEREPITDANVGDATSGPGISEEEHELVLTEERVVVNKETVPVERVRLGKEQVTEQQEVSEDVRKERIELDGDDAAGVTGKGRLDADHDGRSRV